MKAPARTHVSLEEPSPERIAIHSILRDSELEVRSNMYGYTLDDFYLCTLAMQLPGIIIISLDVENKVEARHYYAASVGYLGTR